MVVEVGSHVKFRHHKCQHETGLKIYIWELVWELENLCNVWSTLYGTEIWSFLIKLTSFVSNQTWFLSNLTWFLLNRINLVRALVLKFNKNDFKFDKNDDSMSFSSPIIKWWFKKWPITLADTRRDWYVLQ